MNLRNYLVLPETYKEHCVNVYKRYQQLYTDPDHCAPMIVINTSAVVRCPSIEEQLENPYEMLKAQLDLIRPHIEIMDDTVPTIRVEFGTGQVASAFGCELATPTNSLPAVSSHAIKSIDDIYKIEMPSLDSGCYKKLKEYTDVFIENLPDGVHIQHPDIQSPFNNAHLIRGDEIFLDFYDNPEAVDLLLEKVTDYMITLTPYLKDMISNDKDWFFDWGATWKGTARISNCSMHMISPELYRKHILAQDVRFFKAVGGGRMHYCGSHGSVIDWFFTNPSLTGLDYDSTYHDLWSLCERAPKNVVLLADVNLDTETGKRLLSGEWPNKKNIIIHAWASSTQQGKDMYRRLKASVNKHFLTV